MKNNAVKMRCKRGFTLIELLVVVLIIGVLAAVALPQYNKAVKKTHMAEALTIMDANSKDAQAYLLEHGELARWSEMVNSYADLWGKNSAFGTYFQIGCGDTNPAYANGEDTFYCIEPKNGDKAYIYHWIDKMGKVDRFCLGEDCAQYIGTTNNTCSYEAQPWQSAASCTTQPLAKVYGCSF